MKKEIYVIGDVHGCYNTLMELIKKLPKNAELIFVGDLVDKGPHSDKVIDFVLNNNYKCIKGNHEKYMSLYIEEALYQNVENKWSTSYNKYGGAQTLKNYLKESSKLQKHLSWINTLPSYIIIDNYFITHGYGLPFFKRRDEEDYIKMLTNNRLFNSKYIKEWENTSSHEMTNIFGHCHFENVEIGINYYGIDTGCVYKNKLTAINLYSEETIQVDCIDIIDARVTRS